MSFERSLLSAQGYIELEMLDDALQEIEAIPPKDQSAKKCFKCDCSSSCAPSGGKRRSPFVPGFVRQIRSA
jgi:hypothetical protein